MTEKFSAGKIRISLVNGDEETPVRITLVDDSSNCHLLEIKMTLTEFSAAVLCNMNLSCLYLLEEDCPRGKKREVKTVSIVVQGKSYHSKENIRQAISVYEVDGWKGRDSDATNSYNITNYCDQYYEVSITFIRFI